MHFGIISLTYKCHSGSTVTVSKIKQSELTLNRFTIVAVLIQRDEHLILLLGMHVYLKNGIGGILPNSTGQVKRHLCTVL